MSTICFSLEKLGNVGRCCLDTETRGLDADITHWAKRINMVVGLLETYHKANDDAYCENYSHHEDVEKGDYYTRTEILRAIREAKPDYKEARSTLTLMNYNLDDQKTFETYEAIHYFFQYLWTFYESNKERGYPERTVSDSIFDEVIRESIK